MTPEQVAKFVQVAVAEMMQRRLEGSCVAAHPAHLIEEVITTDHGVLVRGTDNARFVIECRRV